MTKCRKCEVTLEEDEPQQNGLCIDCFAKEWGELIELSPIATPQIDLLEKRKREIEEI